MAKEIIIVGIIILLVWGFANYVSEPTKVMDNENETQKVEQQSKEIIPIKKDQIIENKIFNLVNKERARYGVQPLIFNDKLNELAQRHSDKMMNENFFEHSNDNVGENIVDIPLHYWVEGCGVVYTNNQIAKCMVKGWIESKGHHENMISLDYSLTGIGVTCELLGCKGTQNFL